MTDPAAEAIPAELVAAALRVAERLTCRVGDIPVETIAREAGISRSTLLRRLGGSRRALDEAVRASGIDPGGAPVRDRAIEAAAHLLDELGVGLTTLEAIADRADCSVDSLYATFGTRDELLAAVFERYGPLPDITEVLGAGGDLSSTVREAYRHMATILMRRPRVAPALLAEALARPTSTAVRAVVARNAPRILQLVTSWLDGQIRAGRIRDLPAPLLIQQFAAPVMAHMVSRPLMIDADLGPSLPSIEETCDVFADAFLRAVATNPDAHRFDPPSPPISTIQA